MSAGTNSGLITVGDTQYCVGLFWQTASSIQEAEKEAVRVAKERGIEADLYCVRKSETVQFGLGKTDVGFSEGVSSAIAGLADVLSGTWVGVFQCAEGWVFAGVRKGVIMPDGDALYYDEDSAKERLLADLSLGEWANIYAPSSWDITDAAEQRIAELLIGVKSAKLKPVQVSGKSYASMAIFLGVLGIIGWLLFFGGVDTIKGLIPKPEVAEAPPVDTSVPPPAPVLAEYIPAPWIGLPDGTELVQTCVKEIATIEVVPGYVAQSIGCNPSGFGIIYKREFGTIEWAKLIESNLTATVGYPNADEVSLDYTYSDEIKTFDENSVAAENTGIEKDFWGMQQTYGWDLTYTITPPAHIPPDSPPDTAKPFPAWQYAYTLTGGVDPRSMVEIFSHYPLHTVNIIKFEPVAKIWTIEGIIYAVPKQN